MRYKYLLIVLLIAEASIVSAQADLEPTITSEVIPIEEPGTSRGFAVGPAQTQNINIRQQPTTNVIASPLQESRAEQIRRIRKDAEVSTEQKIVEKLENSRLEDEKKRANRLFGQPLNGVQQETYQAPVQNVQNKNEKLKEDLKEELAATVRAELRNKNEEKKPEGRAYISGFVGMLEYKDAVNIKSDAAYGGAFGYQTANRVTVEGSFTYSSHVLNEGYYNFSGPIFRYIDQYSVGVVGKYAILPTQIRPVIGALASYTYRKYTKQRNYYNSYYRVHTSVVDDATSNAVDVGFIVGLDIDLAEGFSVGVDYRYTKNLSNSNDSTYLGPQYRAEGTIPVEELDTEILSLVGRLSFE